ncbi:MAG: amidohydrolase [Bacteroidales bacterium]|nr:amidohydrolase [Bacteroidales bacterium]
MHQLRSKTLNLAREIHAKIVEYRRHFHAHPELSMQEFETASYIAERLKEWNIPFKSGIAKTGIVATIKGKNPGKDLIALRADMDALPIKEVSPVPYKSQNEGVMHACGHDVHMASLLGTVYILNQLKDEWEGSVRVIFQPSEEAYPGGASLMIKEGVLENPQPRCIFGQHVFPNLDTGMFGFRPGPSMASTDEVYITVKGKGGHGATPELNIDPVVAAANILIALQQLVSRNAPPLVPTVLSFGRFIADGKMNIIPNEVTLDGTIRTYDEEWRKAAHEKITQIAEKTAEAHGATCDVRIVHGYPSLLNDKEVTERAMKHAAELLGQEMVQEIEPRMTAEDFAYYSRIVPACFYRIGIQNTEQGITANLHTPDFDIDENALLTGPALMAWLAIRELQNGI